MATVTLTDRHGSEWSAVQPYANLAAFPAVGLQGILYVDTSVTPNNQGYRWDDALATYVPLGAVAATCPAPMTRAALIALRNSGGLSKDCDYVITDHVQGRLVAGTTIHLQAVDASTLSESVAVKTTYDNEAWAGVYDLDRGIVMELTDNRGNRAKDYNGTQVANFDWGNASYTNVVVDNATLIADIGNAAVKANITVRKNGTLNLTGFFGAINNFDVENFGNANFTNANGTWRMARVADNSAFNCSGYTGGGDSYYFEVLHNASVNLSNRTSVAILRTAKMHAGAINASGVSTGALSIQDCPTLHSSSINQSPGAGAMTLNRAELGQAIVANEGPGGTLTVNNTRVAEGARVAQRNAGSLSISNSQVDNNANVYNYGTGAVVHSRLHARQLAQVYLEVGSTIGLTTTDTTVEASGSISSVGAAVSGAFNINATRVASSSFIYKRAAHTGSLAIAQSDISGSSGVDAQSGGRSYNITRLCASEVSRITLTGTGAVTDTISDLNMTTRAGLRISCSGPANSLLYSRISGLSGSMDFSGTTGGQTCTRLKAADGTIRFANCSANMNAALCSASDLGQIICQNMSVAKNIQYCDVDSNATLQFSGASGGGTVQGVKVSASARMEQSGTAGTASRVTVFGGTLNHTGGSLTNVTKGGSGTLATGNFAHSDVVCISNATATLTAANTNRARYTGLGNAAYAPTGQLV